MTLTAWHPMVGEFEIEVEDDSPVVFLLRRGMTEAISMDTNVGRVEVFLGADSQYYYRAIGRNGETLNTSEGYTRRGTAADEAGKVYPGIKITFIPEAVDDE